MIELTGSEKQIVWATSIRQEYVNKCQQLWAPERLEVLGKIAEMFEDLDISLEGRMQQTLNEFVKLHPDAKFWIENKDKLSVSAILGQAVLLGFTGWEYKRLYTYAQTLSAIQQQVLFNYLENRFNRGSLVPEWWREMGHDIDHAGLLANLDQANTMKDTILLLQHMDGTIILGRSAKDVISDQFQLWKRAAQLATTVGFLPIAAAN